MSTTVTWFGLPVDPVARGSSASRPQIEVAALEPGGVEASEERRDGARRDSRPRQGECSSSTLAADQLAQRRRSRGTADAVADGTVAVVARGRPRHSRSRYDSTRATRSAIWQRSSSASANRNRRSRSRTNSRTVQK